MDEKTLGQLIVDYRARNNLTQEQFGKLVGINKLAVHFLENGKNKRGARKTTVSKIMQVLGN